MRKVRHVADMPERVTGLYVVHCAGIHCGKQTTIPKCIEYMGLHFCSADCAQRFSDWFADWCTKNIYTKSTGTLVR